MTEQKRNIPHGIEVPRNELYVELSLVRNRKYQLWSNGCTLRNLPPRTNAGIFGYLRLGRVPKGTIKSRFRTFQDFEITCDPSVHFLM